MIKALSILGLTAIFQAAMTPDAWASASDKSQPPKLTVVIVIDQLREADLEDFQTLWQDGFLRLTTEGSWYTHAQHGHGRTETAAGHATIGTGVHPRWHGVVDKRIYHREKDAVLNVCNFGPTPCESTPLLVPTLGDRLKQRHPKSKVVAIAQKARAAMLMGGTRADLVAWDESDTEPLLLGRSNGQPGVPAWMQSRYRLLVPDATSIAAGRSNAPVWELPKLPQSFSHIKDQGAGEVGCGLDVLGAASDTLPRQHGTTFPHHLLPAHHGPSFYRSWHCTPASDQAIKDITVHAMQHMQLGKDNHPDLLWMSLSAIDVAGHHFGAESLERAAGLAALDRTLGEFVRDVVAWVGSPNDVVIALTADHGVGLRIDTTRAQGKPAGRVSAAVLSKSITDALEADLVLTQQYGKSVKKRPLLAFAFPFVHLGYAPGPGRDRAIATAVAALERNAAVLHAWPTRALAELATDDPIAALMYENAHPDRAGDISLVLKPGFTITYDDPNDERGVDHGSPMTSDLHVPVIMWGRGIAAKKHVQPVAVIDLMRSISDGLQLPPDPHGGTALPE